MKLSNKFGEAFVQPLGAMLYDCAFHLSNGKTVKPLYDAPWRNENHKEMENQPPIIQWLGSEWPCVPFGRSPENLELPLEWTKSNPLEWDEWAHGYGSNHEWSLESISEDHVIATIDYPDNSPIKKVTREIRLNNNQPGLILSLVVESRKDVSFPLGLHPVLSIEGVLPETFELQLAETTRAWTFPTELEPGLSYFASNQQDLEVHKLLNSVGDVTDVRMLPPPTPSEDLLLLTGTGGSVSLVNPLQNCVTTVQWDSKKLPGCALWISNGGRTYFPWNSRVAALGIEPVAATFDLGLGHSLSNDNPLANKGIKTAITVNPENPFICEYQILVVAI